MHYKCCAYLFTSVFSEDTCRVTVTRNQDDICHSEGIKLTAQVRNIDRAIMQKEMQPIMDS